MSAEANDMGIPPSDTGREVLPAPAYEPPRIAWEEPLEPTMAASSCLLVAFGDCDLRPHDS